VREKKRDLKRNRNRGETQRERERVDRGHVEMKKVHRERR